MANTKVTKREKFENVITALKGIEGTEAEVAFLERELELLKNRSGKARGMTATQKDNEVLKGAIVEVMTGLEEGVTATDVAGLADVSVQKATQMLKQLVEAGTVARTEGKGKEKTTFAVA